MGLASRPEESPVMSMRFTEIGQQLRAYRLESGLRAEEIAARLGVSRAALYRYEKGEVIKLDTIKRLIREAGYIPRQRNVFYQYIDEEVSTETNRVSDMLPVLQ